MKQKKILLLSVAACMLWFSYRKPVAAVSDPPRAGVHPHP